MLLNIGALTAADELAAILVGTIPRVERGFVFTPAPASLVVPALAKGSLVVLTPLPRNQAQQTIVQVASIEGFADAMTFLAVCVIRFQRGCDMPACCSHGCRTAADLPCGHGCPSPLVAADFISYRELALVASGGLQS